MSKQNYSFWDKTGATPVLAESGNFDTTNANIPAWSNAAQYVLGDSVFQGGQVYRAAVAVTTAGTFIPGEWFQVSGAAAIAGAGAFSAAQAYSEGDLVFQAGAVYRSIGNIPAGAFTPAQWDLIGPSSGDVTVFATLAAMTGSVKGEGAIAIVDEGGSRAVFFYDGTNWEKTPGQVYTVVNVGALGGLTGMVPGDLAVQTDTGAAHVYHAGTWKPLGSAGGGSLTTVTNEADVLAIGTPTEGDEAYVTSTGASYAYDATNAVWRKRPGVLYLPANGPAETAIAGQVKGDMLRRVDTGEHKTWDGVAWNSISAALTVSISLANEAAVLALATPSEGDEAFTTDRKSYIFRTGGWLRRSGYVFRPATSAALPTGGIGDGLGDTPVAGDFAQTGDTNGVYIHDGTNWVAVPSGAAITSAANFGALPAPGTVASGTVGLAGQDGSYISDGATWTPLSTRQSVVADSVALAALNAPQTGDIAWQVDTTALQVWTGAAWVQANSSIAQTITVAVANEAALPAGPATGDEAFLADGRHFIWNGTQWRRRTGYTWFVADAGSLPAGSVDGSGTGDEALPGDHALAAAENLWFYRNAANNNWLRTQAHLVVTVANVAALPPVGTSIAGDVAHVTADDSRWTFNGTAWDRTGGSFITVADAAGIAAIVGPLNGDHAFRTDNQTHYVYDKANTAWQPISSSVTFARSALGQTAGLLNFDTSGDEYQFATLTGNLTVASLANQALGRKRVLELTQPAAGAAFEIYNLEEVTDFVGGSWSTRNGATNYLTLECVDEVAPKWISTLSNDEQSLTKPQLVYRQDLTANPASLFANFAEVLAVNEASATPLTETKFSQLGDIEYLRGANGKFRFRLLYKDGGADQGDLIWEQESNPINYYEEVIGFQLIGGSGTLTGFGGIARSGISQSELACLVGGSTGIASGFLCANAITPNGITQAGSLDASQAEVAELYIL